MLVGGLIKRFAFIKMTIVERRKKGENFHRTIKKVTPIIKETTLAQRNRRHYNNNKEFFLQASKFRNGNNARFAQRLLF